MKNVYYIVAGGDKRFSNLAELLLREGELVTLWDKAPYPPFPSGAQITLVLPFSLPHEQIVWLLRECPYGTTVYGGALPEAAKRVVTEKGLEYNNILSDNDYCVKNAIPTAEGALSIAICETGKTINGSKVLVMGYGRVGKACASLFSSAGAGITVAARRKETVMEAEEEGFRTIFLPFSEKSSLYCFDIIINTVPKENIIDEHIIKLFCSETIIIELASGKNNICRSSHPKVIYAPSLPGKYSPKTAAKILFSSIYRKDDSHK